MHLLESGSNPLGKKKACSNVVDDILWYLGFLWHDMAAHFPQFQGFIEQSFSCGRGFDRALWNTLLIACAFSLSPLVALLHAGCEGTCWIQGKSPRLGWLTSCNWMCV